jgi:hypothetical protein
MTEPEHAPEIVGKTIRFIWADGPTAGKTHEHVFNPDGSVEYAPVENGTVGKFTREKRYVAFKVAQDVFLVSYLGASGYTLTMALNFADGSLCGVASGAKDWFAVKGRFEVMP